VVWAGLAGGAGELQAACNVLSDVSKCVCTVVTIPYLISRARRGLKEGSGWWDVQEGGGLRIAQPGGEKTREEGGTALGDVLDSGCLGGKECRK
jgi:hypothetical protein